MCLVGAHRDLHSFPTRRSSDLAAQRAQHIDPDDRLCGREHIAVVLQHHLDAGVENPRGHVRALDVPPDAQKGPALDRKSTRLNSSHVKISYAVFCLKKKNTKYA